MATDLYPARPAPGSKKHEAFVLAQLARARTRIRTLDVAAAGLGLLILTFAYGLILALCDRWLEFPPLVRQTAFGVYAAGALVYLALLIVRPLCRPINPYYAARRLEQTIPEAKNSVVNWLDLHQQPMAPAFHNAIGHQAAKDLADADLDEAISARRASWLGAGAAALFLCLLILFVLGPRQFLSLMNRAFAPFVEASIATRTRLMVVRPEGGDVTIPVGRAVGFSVWVEGRIPEASSPQALKLLYRYNQSDPYSTRLLERGGSTREWLTTLPASEVHNGFWYRITGGDGETDEYRVQVRSTPLLVGCDVTYHYRPYLNWPDRLAHDPNLQDLRGTEVTLLARTNRTVNDGQLIIDGQRTIAAERVSEDPQVMKFHLRLEADGSYRIWFRSVEGERNIDPMAYTIRVLQDHPPQVELTKPGEDNQLPANGVLRLEGSASDDFGLARINLRMKVENGPALQTKPYRKADGLRRGDGSYPQMLAYRDFVELDKLQTEGSQPLEPLQAGTKIEYWLEAIDNCDYPGPNIGESKHFKITIQLPDTDKKKQEQQRQDARQEQQRHEKQQDQNLQNQKREPPDRPSEQNPPPRDADQPGKESDQQNDDKLNQQKERIEEAIKKHEQQEKAGEKGESKGDRSPESKGEGTGEGSGMGQVDKAQNKDKGGGEGKQQPGQDKGSGKSEASPEKGEQKGEGQAAGKSEGDRGNGRGQQGAEPRTDHPTTEGNKEGSTPAPRQQDGPNGASKNTEPRPKPSGEGQAQDAATHQSGSGEKKTESNREGKGGEKANSDKEQNRGEGQKKGSSQGDMRNSSELKGARPNAGQGTDREQRNIKKEQGADQQQKGGSGETDKDRQPGPEKTGQSGAAKKPEPSADKNETKGPGSDGAKQEAAQAKGELKPEANAAKARENSQNGQKTENGNSGRQPAEGQKKGRPEPRTGKAEESQGESKAGSQTGSQSEPKSGAGQRDGGDPKAAAKKNPASGTGENIPKSQEKSARGDQRQDGDHGQAKAVHKQDSQNPKAEGDPQTSKAEDKGRPGSGHGQDNVGAQQPKTGRQGATKDGRESKDNVSALSEALKDGDDAARADARKKLEQLRDKSKDPAVRRAAADALKRAEKDGAEKTSKKGDGTKPADSKGRPEQPAPSKSSDNAPGREKGKPSDKSGTTQRANDPMTDQSDASKSERKNADNPEAKRDSGADKSARSQPSSSGRPGGSGASARQGGNELTGQAANPNDAPDSPGRGQDTVEPPTPPNPDSRRRAGELQLEDIKKRVTKDVLKQLNMSEEDFEKFSKAYEEMLKRKHPAGAEKENLAGPQRGNRAGSNPNVRRVDAQEQGKPGNLRRFDPASAPAEFREAYREFSRHISELEQTKDKR